LNFLFYVFGRALNVNMFLIRGQVKNTSHSATTLFMGSEESAYQLAHLVYFESGKIVRLGKALSCGANALDFPKIEIIGVCANRSILESVLDQGYLLLPFVNFSLDLTLSMAAILGKSSRRRRRDVKRMKDNGFSYAIGIANESDFDFFYWKMYLPYVLNRHGKAARIPSHSIMKSLYDRDGGVIFVKKGNKPVAGILFQVRGETIYALHSGAYAGDYSLVKGLAGQAALFFLIEWAKSKGIKRLDCGNALPFFSDGVFSYKKQWGMFVEKSPNEVFCALKIDPQKGALCFLQQNPCIFVEKGATSGVVLVDHSPTDKELQRIFSKYYFPKMDSLIVIAYYAQKLSVSSETRFSTSHENRPSKPLQHICSSLMKKGYDVEEYILAQ
jgi:hypothetical protein